MASAVHIAGKTGSGESVCASRAKQTAKAVNPRMVSLVVRGNPWALRATPPKVTAKAKTASEKPSSLVISAPREREPLLARKYSYQAFANHAHPPIQGSPSDENTRTVRRSGREKSNTGELPGVQLEGPYLQVMS
jgi:hypothetical protein